MGYQRVCDLCGRPLSEAEREFKIKERWTLWHESGWDKIECHTECLRVLLVAARRRRDEDAAAQKGTYLIDRNRLFADLNATMTCTPEINTIIMAQPRCSEPER